MKIVHVVDPFAGGLATFLKLLTEELNHNYHIIIHGERKNLADAKEIKEFFPKKNVKFIFWKSAQRKINFAKDLSAYFELVSILRRFRKADVIHLHSSKAGFLGRVACRYLGIKQVIYTPNGAPFLMKNASNLKLKIYENLEKFASYFGGKIICASESEQMEYERRGIKANYINNGTKITKNSFSLEKDYNKFRIVTSGRIVNQKNPKLFNEIAKSFDGLKHFEFVWIGAGEDINKLTSSNIRVTGWLSKEGVKNEIIKADLYLSTSNFEGLPFAVIEAMALGKCLLLSDCTGNTNLVKKSFNGEKFKTKEEAINHIFYFYLNKEVTESMGLNSLEVCRDYFNIEQTAYQYQQQYLQMKTFGNTSKSFVSKFNFNSINPMLIRK